jgi:hypothetical protein
MIIPKSVYDYSNTNEDTLFLTDTSIHFIKIGGQVFEIKALLNPVPAWDKPKSRPCPIDPGFAPQKPLFNIDSLKNGKQYIGLY